MPGDAPASQRPGGQGGSLHRQAPQARLRHTVGLQGEEVARHAGREVGPQPYHLPGDGGGSAGLRGRDDSAPAVPEEDGEGSGKAAPPLQHIS